MYHVIKQKENQQKIASNKQVHSNMQMDIFLVFVKNNFGKIG